MKYWQYAHQLLICWLGIQVIFCIEMSKQLIFSTVPVWIWLRWRSMHFFSSSFVALCLFSLVFSITIWFTHKNKRFFLLWFDYWIYLFIKTLLIPNFLCIIIIYQQKRTFPSRRNTFDFKNKLTRKCTLTVDIQSVHNEFSIMKGTICARYYSSQNRKFID